MKSVVNLVLVSDLALRDLLPKQKMNKLKRWRHWRQVVAILEIAGLTAAGGPVGAIAVAIAAEAIRVFSEKRRADQPQGGRAERRYIQAWRSRRALRRPGVASLLLSTEREGPEERSAGLCAELGEMPAASAGMTESGFGKVKHTSLRFRGSLSSRGASFSLTVRSSTTVVRTDRAGHCPGADWRFGGMKMHVTPHFIENAMLHNPPPEKVNKLKSQWRHYAQRVPYIPWRRVAGSFGKTLLRLAVRIMEDAVAEIAVMLVVEIFRSLFF